MALLSMWQASRNSDSVRIWDSDIVGEKNSNLPFELSIITESLGEESKTERDCPKSVDNASGLYVAAVDKGKVKFME